VEVYEKYMGQSTGGGGFAVADWSKREIKVRGKKTISRKRDVWEGLKMP